MKKPREIGIGAGQDLPDRHQPLRKRQVGVATENIMPGSVRRPRSYLPFFCPVLPLGLSPRTRRALTRIDPPRLAPLPARHRGHDIGERVAYLEVAMMRREPPVFRSCVHGMLALGLAGLTGCGGEYSPNTYSATAVQQANKVAQGVVVGVREIKVSA